MCSHNLIQNIFVGTSSCLHHTRARRNVASLNLFSRKCSQTPHKDWKQLKEENTSRLQTRKWTSGCQYILRLLDNLTKSSILLSHRLRKNVIQMTATTENVQEAAKLILAEVIVTMQVISICNTILVLIS